MAADFNIIKTSDPIAVGDNFIAVVALTPSDFVMVSSVQIVLNFDPAVLQVVPGTHPSGPLQPGTSVECNRFQDILVNTMDNVTGEASFVAQAGFSGMDVFAHTSMAAVEFTAIAEAVNTVISFATAPLATKVLVGFNDVTGVLNSTTFDVVSPLAPALADLFRCL